ncbi:MAG: UxaA family hydrolase [Devosia sp.]|nr:UxaA family hydrolase [Devosia sp.]
MSALLMLAPTDPIAVAVRDIEPGETITLPDGSGITMRNRVPFGFKVAIRAIGAGEKVFKYNVPIGTATMAIAPGEVVHLNNLRSDYIATRRERT